MIHSLFAKIKYLCYYLIMQTKEISRRSLLLTSVVGILAACPKPNPNDPTVVVTGSWVARTREIITKVRSISLSSIRILESINIIPHAVMEGIRIGYDIVEGATNALETALNSYEASGGDTCRVYATAVALKSAIIALARMLVRNGFWIGLPMEMVADSLFSLIDALLNRCENDAGFRSITSEGNSELRRIQESATTHLRNDLDRAE